MDHLRLKLKFSDTVFHASRNHYVYILQENLQQAAGLIDSAALRGAEVVFLPEAFDFIGETGAETLALAEPIHGPIVRDTYTSVIKTNQIIVPDPVLSCL